MTVFKLPVMSDREVQNVVQSQFLCRIAFHGGKYPYIAPFQYTFLNDSLYFHFANYGRKMRLLEGDNRVCVEIERYTPDLSEYEFVVLQGTLRVVTDSKERLQVIKRMAHEAESKLSPNFLAAHGFHQHQSWSSFSSDKPLVIVKLENVEQVAGLKNP